MARIKPTDGFGKPYVRGDGRWVVPYRPDTASKLEKIVVPRREPIRTAKQAIEWASAKILQQRLDGTFKAKPVSKDGPCFKELADRWLKLRKPDEEISGATYDANKSHMDVHLLPAFGDLPIAGFEDVQGQKLLADWLRKLKERHGQRGAQTVRNITATLRTFFDWTTGPEAGAQLRMNPTRTEWFRRLLPKRQQTDARFATLEDAPLSPAQVQALLDTKVIELQWRARIALAFTSPLRDGEIAGLRICDLALDAETPWIDIHKACVLNHRDGHAKIGKTKRIWSNRTLPLHEAARDGIKEWLDSGWEEFVGRPPKPTDPVFPRDDGKHGRPRSAVAFRAALTLAGLPDTIKGTALHFHDARGCVATWLANLHVDGRFDGALIRRFLGQAPQGAAEANYFKGNLLPALAAEQKKITLVWSRPETVTDEVLPPAAIED